MSFERKLRWVGFMIVQTAIALMLIGCTMPQQMSKVAQNNASAAGRVALAYSRDSALLRELLAAQIAVQRTIKYGDVHREMIMAGYVNASTGAPDVTAFMRDVVDARTTTALVREVRFGRMTNEQAQRWLSDYAQLGLMSDARARQDVLVSSLGDSVAFNDAADTLLAQLDAHNADVGALLGDLAQGNQAVLDFLSHQNVYDWRAIGASSTPALSEALLAHVSDPLKRQAASDLLASVLKPLTK